jgi:adenine-specific DNA-methyltransferase
MSNRVDGQTTTRRTAGAERTPQDVHGSHPIQRRYLAEDLVRLRRSDERRRYVASQRAGRIDPNPHQIDAVVFALSRLPEGGCILADEVGLGKTIEAGLVIAQRLAEGARRVLLVTPKPLLGQWKQELYTLFGIETREGHAEAGGFDGGGVFIVGREFVGGERGAAALRSAERFDLCVVDEAHEVFAGIYRRFDRYGEYRDDADAAATAARLRAVLEGSDTPVLLLTATPIQNSLPELWGLVQYVDPSGTLLGDLPTFREMFCPGDDRVPMPGQEHELRQRMQSVLKRTLRRQAQEFMERPFVGRHAQLFEYQMSPEERRLYDDVTAYLLEPGICAFRGNQRRLLLIGFHRRMASSIRALSASLERVAARLRRMLASGPPGPAIDEDAAVFAADLEDDDDEAAGDTNVGAPPPAARVQAELERVEAFITRSRALPDDSKARALIKAVRVALDRADGGRQSGKVVVFTESLTTQDYLRELLLESRLVSDDEITLFRGVNDSPRAAQALARWQEEVGCNIPTYQRPSRDVAVRLALVHEFKTRSRVFISTEAGAKGLNLQFCSTLINYDLPWNPQRIEQRIGRCHRYGQTHDVTVINFLARDNEAQRLTFDILSQKLELFGTVLGASDEVLHHAQTDAPEPLVGALGAEVESRLRRIYERAGTIEEIGAELRQLHDALGSRRQEFEEAHKRTADVIKSRFDESVQEVFRRIRDELPGELRQLDRDLEGVVTRYLDAIGAAYEREATDSRVVLRIAACDALPEGLRDGIAVTIGHSGGLEDVDPLHPGHPLVAAALAEARDATGGPFRLRIHASDTPDLRPLRGRAGHLILARVRYDGFEPCEKLLPLVLLEGEQEALDAGIASRLIACPIEDDAESSAVAVPEEDAADALELLVFTGGDDVLRSDDVRFERAMAQIERFADDRLLVLRRQHSRLAERVAAAQADLERASGAQQRTEAEQRLKRLQVEAEELESRIEALESRRDDRYQRSREQIQARRYATPRVERLLAAELRIV